VGAAKTSRAYPAAPSATPPPPPAKPELGERTLEKRKELADVAQNQPAAKLHPSIAAVIAGNKQAAFVSNGKADIQIWLTEKNATTLAQLKQLGFEVTSDPSGSKLVIGKIAVEKLAKLAELSVVRFVAPYQR
jgi:hypothetical protein